MLEIPEATTIARQLNEVVKGKVVVAVTTEDSAGMLGFSFFEGNPAKYSDYLVGKTWGEASAHGGLIESKVEDYRIVFGDGVKVRYLEPGGTPPKKCLMQIEFKDGSLIVCTVQMYGGMWVFKAGENDNFYYLVAKEKPSPLSDGFTREYFESIIDEAKPALSAKALLATDQRIPGIGNGSTQDILYKSRVHPKRKISTFAEDEIDALYANIKETLKEMVAGGGRDTEKDLFGEKGRYQTILSSKTWKMPCRECGGAISRKAYMGGNVYYCPICQPE
jgi:formamidopyrimidine-DNA glycosylase